MFEIVICKRDNLGNPIIGKYMSYKTEDAGKLCAWFERNATGKRKKKKKKAQNNKS
jgi:hypothetical protein